MVLTHPTTQLYCKSGFLSPVSEPRVRFRPTHECRLLETVPPIRGQGVSEDGKFLETAPRAQKSAKQPPDIHSLSGGVRSQRDSCLIHLTEHLTPKPFHN